MSDSAGPRDSEAFQRSDMADGISDAVIDAYKKDVDRTLLRNNLELSVEGRFLKFEQFMAYIHDLKEAGQRIRSAESGRHRLDSL
jgi:hypothetical protein